MDVVNSPQEKVFSCAFVLHRWNRRNGRRHMVSMGKTLHTVVVCQRMGPQNEPFIVRWFIRVVFFYVCFVIELIYRLPNRRQYRSSLTSPFFFVLFIGQSHYRKYLSPKDNNGFRGNNSVPPLCYNSILSPFFLQIYRPPKWLCLKLAAFVSTNAKQWHDDKNSVRVEPHSVPTVGGDGVLVSIFLWMS